MKKLERSLGLTSVIAISVSAMLGSGIFVLPGLAAAKTGPSVWLAYLVSGLIVLPATFSKAELATAMPTSGGTFIYIDRTFGPVAGTIAGLGLWLSLLLKAAFALVGFSAYLHVVAPLPLKAMALVLLVVVVVINIVGVRAVGRVQSVVVVISIVGLAAILAMGVDDLDTGLMEPFLPEGAHGFLAAAGFVFVSYAGVTKTAAIAEEVKDPDRNLPLGMLLSLLLVGIMYGLVVFFLVGIVPVDELATDLHPIYTLAVKAVGPVFGVTVAIIGVLTMTSMANSGVLAASRFPFAMSRDKLLPPLFKQIHPSLKTPVPCIVLTGAVMAAVIIFFDVERIAKLASAIIILCFAMVNLSVIVLRELGVRWYKPSYTSPMYPWMQLFGLIGSAVLFVLLGLSAVLTAAAIVVAGIVMYAIYGRQRVQRRGAMGRMGRRQDLRVLPSLPSDASTIGEVAAVAALFGRERSPETIVEIAGVIARGRDLEVAYITEVPDQTALDAWLEDEPVVASLERRVGALAEVNDFSISFDTIVTHDMVKTVHELTNRTHCLWLVKEWHSRAHLGQILRHPRSWLLDVYPCNVAIYRDSGIRYVREILVYAEPGPHDALVVATADHLAKSLGAEVTFVLYLADGADQVALQATADYIDELCILSETRPQTTIVRGSDPVQAIARASSYFDLLVVGAPPEPTKWQLLSGTHIDRLTELAQCSVLQLRTHPEVLPKVIDQMTRAVTGSQFSLLEYLDERAIVVQAPEVHKDELFDRLAVHFATILPDTTHMDIADALWKRERIQNTYVKSGIATPHGTIPSLGRPYLGIVTTRSTVGYQTRHGEEPDVFFVTFGPPRERLEHFKMLGQLARLLEGGDLVSLIRSATDPTTIYDAFCAACEGTEALHGEPMRAKTATFTYGSSAAEPSSAIPGDDDHDDAHDEGNP